MAKISKTLYNKIANKLGNNVNHDLLETCVRKTKYNNSYEFMKRVEKSYNKNYKSECCNVSQQILVSLTGIVIFYYWFCLS